VDGGGGRREAWGRGQIVDAYARLLIE
jgi:hypothetical protein